MNLIKKKLIYRKRKDPYSIPLSSIKEGINNFRNFIIFKGEKKFNIFDRTCDHSGGKLLTNNVTKEVICPLHGWKLNPKTGEYTNVKLKKKSIDYKVSDGMLRFFLENKYPVINESKKNFKLEIKFINHACLIIKTDFIKFAIDPWVLGPAFLGGWSLKKRSPFSSFEELNECDFIYISHNHPDHLHDLTLQKIDSKITYIFPNFKNKSVENYLRALGKKKLIGIDFGFEYYFKDKNTKICAFKSGDFRDDSGLFFNIGNFSSVLAVDSNSLNFLNLPKKITLLASSFAGGASGFPVCFDNYNENEKIEIIKRNNKSLIARNKQLIASTGPKYYMPYAGFFSEKADRDKDIKRINKKIKIQDYEKILDKTKINILNLEKNQIFRFDGKNLINKERTNKYMDEMSVENYIDFQKKSFNTYNEKKIREYFENSNFRSNLKIFISLTDDQFKKNYQSFLVDFTTPKTKVEFLKIDTLFDKDLKSKDYNIIYFKIRNDSFTKLIEDMLPWEDLLIGFQTRIKRFPDIYNVDFWYHFTNIYVKKTRKSSITQCNYCIRVMQSLNVPSKNL